MNRRAIVVLLAIAAFVAYFIIRPPETLYKREFSPDGRYVVEVYFLPWFDLLPTAGSGSDAPVSIYLKSAKGRTLKRWGKDLMLQTSGPVEWFKDAVLIGSVSYECTDIDKRIDQ